MALEVETEPEVRDWYLQLSADERDVVATHIDLLADLGHMIRMPHARQLARAGTVRAAVQHVPSLVAHTYWHRPDGVIVLLTVFHKQRNNEAAEVARARRALQTCRARHQP